MDTREFVHVNGVDRMGAYEGTELHSVLSVSPEWKEVEAQSAATDDTGGDQDPEPDTDALPEGVKAEGGGWYLLPNGDKVRGRKALDAALAAIDDTGGAS